MNPLFAAEVIKEIEYAAQCKEDYRPRNGSEDDSKHKEDLRLVLSIACYKQGVKDPRSREYYVQEDQNLGASDNINVALSKAAVSLVLKHYEETKESLELKDHEDVNAEFDAGACQEDDVQGFSVFSIDLRALRFEDEESLDQQGPECKQCISHCLYLELLSPKANVLIQIIALKFGLVPPHLKDKEVQQEVDQGMG